MSDLLLPISSSFHKESMFFETQRFNFSDGTVCLVRDDISKNRWLEVLKHESGEPIEVPMPLDEMLFEEEPAHSEIGASKAMIARAVMDRSKRTGENAIQLLQNFQGENPAEQLPNLQ